MTGDAVEQIEELKNEILLHLGKMLHIYPSKSAPQADRHQITKSVTRRITCTGIVFIIDNK